MKFSKKLSDFSSILNNPAEEKKEEQTSLLRVLPEELLISHTFQSFLSPRDKSKTAEACKQMHGIFRKGLETDKRVNKLFNLIWSGMWEEAIRMAKENPCLLLKKSVFTAPSNDFWTGKKRVFLISPAQLAKWCRDPVARIFWEISFKLFPEEAKKRFEESESKETDYVEKYGESFDFSPIEQTYMEYASNHNQWNQNDRKKYWCTKICGLQKSFHGWPAQCLCGGTNDWTNPDDAEFEAVSDDSKRIAVFTNLISNRRETFFDFVGNPEKKFAIYSTVLPGRSYAWVIPVGGFGIEQPKENWSPSSNLAAFRHFNAANTKLHEDLMGMYCIAQQQFTPRR